MRHNNDCCFNGVMPVRTFLRNFIVLAATVSLTGCVSLKLPATGKTEFTKKSSQTRATQLQQIKKWDIDGAFSIQYNKKSELANYTWQQTYSKYLINISSALNLYTISINGRPGHAYLKESKHKPLSARSPESLLQKRLGWSIPISSLKYWVRGLPANSAGSKSYDKYGHLTYLSQQGFVVYFSNYTNVGKYDLPRILKISGHGLKIKLAIKHWSL